MKKIFTLLFTVGIFSAAFAQPGTRNDRVNQPYDQRDKQYDQRDDQQNSQWDNNKTYNNGIDIELNNGRYDNSNGARGMELRIAQINRKYNYQVQRVRNDFFMGRYEKMRVIRSLEMQRQQEIRNLYMRSGHNRMEQYDRGYDVNRRY